MKKASACLAVVTALASAPIPRAQAPRSLPASQPTINVGDVHVLPVKGNVYMLVGAGANIALQVGDDGVLLVDTGTAAKADAVLAAIKQLTDKPIRWILNTNFHEDHTGANESIAKAGS